MTFYQRNPLLCSHTGIIIYSVTGIISYSPTGIILYSLTGIILYSLTGIIFTHRYYIIFTHRDYIHTQVLYYSIHTQITGFHLKAAFSGPDRAAVGDGYLYVESNFPPVAMATSIRSSYIRLSPRKSADRCLEFRYHMFGIA